MMKKVLTGLTITGLLALPFVSGAKGKQVAPSYSWVTTMPLGDMEPSTIDTTFINYAQKSIPSWVTDAWATTGNLGSEGLNMIWKDRPAASDYYFIDPLTHWIPSLDSFKYYNTRIPMTILSYNFGGGSDNGQDRLKGIFSGNVNKQIQIGAYIDYLYSKGAYEGQAVKDFTYGFSGSYMGDRYKMQASFFHYNLLNKENGGIQNDLYITDPAQVQEGMTSVNPKTIPINLNNAHTRVKGLNFFINNRYSLGYTRVERSDTDTIVRKQFVPVTDLILTFQAQDGSHLFTDTPQAGDAEGFWKRTYYNNQYTEDRTYYTDINVTAGIGLLEGCHKWAKFGLTGFLTYQYQRFKLPDYQGLFVGDDLNPLPDYTPEEGVSTDHKIYVGAQLRSTKGKYINYDVTGRIGVVGAPGEFDVDGSVTGSIPLLGDTLGITGYGKIANFGPSTLMGTYRSNHFIWDNDFSNSQSFRFGGILEFPKSGTTLDIGTETLTNHVYFGPDALPRQHSSGVQTFWASLTQKLSLGPVHWDNTVTYQATSDEYVIPLPALAVRSNLYFTFKIAKVLSVQTGVDCDYYTRYRAPGYQPATMAFYNQDQVLIGNYPWMNVYANFRLSRATFYVMCSHVNQGMMGDRYFSMPHYPLNPRKFQLGISIDFAN